MCEHALNNCHTSVASALSSPETNMFDKLADVSGGEVKDDERTNICPSFCYYLSVFIDSLDTSPLRLTMY